MANSEWLVLYYKDEKEPSVVAIRKSEINWLTLNKQKEVLTLSIDSSINLGDNYMTYRETQWDLTEAIEFVKEFTTKSTKAPITRPAQSESIIADVTQPKTYRDIVLESIPENSYVAHLLRKQK